MGKIGWKQEPEQRIGRRGGAVYQTHQGNCGHVLLAASPNLTGICAGELEIAGSYKDLARRPKGENASRAAFTERGERQNILSRETITEEGSGGVCSSKALHKRLQASTLSNSPSIGVLGNM